MISVLLFDREYGNLHLIHVCKKHEDYVDSMITDGDSFQRVHFQDWSKKGSCPPFLKCDICRGINSGELDDYPK